MKLGRSACRVIPDKREDHEASYKIESADSISNLYSLHMAPSCVAYKDYNPYKTHGGSELLQSIQNNQKWFRALESEGEQISSLVFKVCHFALVIEDGGNIPFQ